MNAARRKRLAEAGALIAQAKATIEECALEERDYFDNMPENMQSGDKGTKADETATALEDAAQSLEELASTIEEATEK